MIGDFVDLPQDGERTNIVGTQLRTGQSETDVTGRDPDLIARVVKRSGGVSGVCMSLVSLNCLL